MFSNFNSLQEPSTSDLLSPADRTCALESNYYRPPNQQLTTDFYALDYATLLPIECYPSTDYHALEDFPNATQSHLLQEKTHYSAKQFYNEYASIVGEPEITDELSPITDFGSEITNLDELAFSCSPSIMEDFPNATQAHLFQQQRHGATLSNAYASIVGETNITDRLSSLDEEAFPFSPSIMEDFPNTTQAHLVQHQHHGATLSNAYASIVEKLQIDDELSLPPITNPGNEITSFGESPSSFLTHKNLSISANNKIYNYTLNKDNTNSSSKNTRVKKNTNNSAQAKTRVRIRFNCFQFEELEREYQLSPYPCKLRKFEISQKLQLTEHQVKVWFQNRRMKDRRQYKMWPVV